MNKIFLVAFMIFSSLFTQAQSVNVIKANNINPETSDSIQRNLFIPNAFTPNGDGLNDIFSIKGITNEHVLEFCIFDRWGVILYKSEDNNAAAWDGRYKGKILPPSVYGYNIKIAYTDGVVETYKGTVTLIN